MPCGARAAPAELDRLEVLRQVAEKVQRTAERLEARYSEGYDHARLDQLEKAAGKPVRRAGRGRLQHDRAIDVDELRALHHGRARL